jgi:Cu+-exporting ATPase
LEFEKSALIIDNIDGEELYFCCKGCQGVYHLLKDEGLGSFYGKRANTTLEPPKENYGDSGRFDLQSFHAKYITTTKDGFSQISLIIEGIHCSACIWLNEKVISRLDGVIEANINFTNNKAHIVWDENVLKLSTIIDKIRSIGYNAYPYDASIQEMSANKERKNSYLRLIIGVFATMNIMWIALALYSGFFGGIKESHQNILHIAEFILATVTLFYSGSIFYRGAYFSARNGTVSMDTLVATGSSIVYAYSVYAAIHDKSEVYFDSVTMIITFVLAGKYLESLSKKQAVDILDTLGANMPTEALVIRDNEKIQLPLDSVAVGDVIEIKSGEHTAIDGVIIAGNGDFDESSITGESLPVAKNIGDEIISGSALLNGVLRYKTTKDYAHSSFCVILKLLEESLAKKPNIENFANSLSRYFSMTILGLSVITFVLHFFIFHKNFDVSLITCVSVIVIACPCALALATPIASIVGVAVGAKKGVIFKASSAIEKLAKASLLFVDKTGTLTIGRPQVIKNIKLSQYDPKILATLVSGSNHPIAKAIKEHIGDIGDKDIVNTEELKARGLSATIESKNVIGGNAIFLHESGVEVPKEYESAGFLLAMDGVLCEAFWLKDKVRADSKEALARIRAIGVEVVMLTGDNEQSAREIAEELAITSYYHSLKPDDKLSHIQIAQEDGKIVVMSGDGINDTLALARADVSVSLSSASDVSIMTADVILLNSNMSGLADAFVIGKKTYNVIKQNIGFSLVYNLITVPVAIAGFVIPPVAAASMSLSSIIVVLNSIRLKGKVI